MKFKVARLKIGDEPFTIDAFNSIEDKSENTKKNDKIIKSSKMIIKYIENKYVTIYIAEGNHYPRPDNVYNSDKDENEKNPREVQQAEQNGQVFVLIDVSTQKIYISDFRKKKFIRNLLQEKTSKQVLLKSIILKEKLVNSLKTLDNIALSFDNNSIFSKVDSLDNALSTNFHNLGLGVKDYTISVDFVNNSPINKKIADWIKNMLKRRDNQELSALTICGRSCDGFERTMNLDLVVDEVKCNVPQDDNGMYRAELVFNSLIAEIR